MNTSMIRYILGHVLRIEALLLLVPCLTAVYYRETQGVFYLLTAALCLTLGVLMTRHKPKSNIFYLKEGCISTSLSWITLSLFGSLPFYISREIPSFTDALFETVSGFTTTGASILSSTESLSHCALLWRCFTHWIGGMGVLVFLLAIIPMSGGSNINLMRAESPGPSVGKLVPKMASSARLLYSIYFGLTLLEIALLVLGGMPFFDSVTTGFSTAGTGGFAIHSDSMAGYPARIQWIVTIFMILFGVNFNAYYFILSRQFGRAFGMEEVRVYFLVILVTTGIIAMNIRSYCSGAFDAMGTALFQVASIITTTGFATTDYTLWPQTSQTVLFFLMFCGACAGSTSGSIKISRLIIAVKTVIKELRSYIHPKIITKVKMDGKPVAHEVVRATNVFIMSFFALFTLSLLAISFEGRDLTTNLTAVTAALNNIGPGLGTVGPASNYGTFRAISKFVLMFDMLAGRLELFPLLILFHPTVWRDAITWHARKRRLAREEHARDARNDS